MARVVLAMSGGVDSSVAAWLLKEQGHEVIGLFMRHGEGRVQGSGFRVQGSGDGVQGSGFRGQELGSAAPPAIPEPRTPNPEPCTPAPSPQPPAPHHGCCTAADAADARRVADALGIPFYALNFEEEFNRIVDYFVDEYVAGRTPNPCIVCNTWLKFGKLFDYADGIGAQYVATGHYARIAQAGNPPSPALLRGCDRGCRSTGFQPVSGSEMPALLRGCDPTKDQSYVLFGIHRALLSRLMLPVGEHGKREIRRMAARLGLPVAEKPDSQEICFVHDDDHARLIHERRPDADTSGEIVTTDGTVVGRHPGLEHFTVGQRKGLRVAFGERRYVVRLEPTTRRVVVGTVEELARHELTAAQANWLVEPTGGPFACEVKIRYRSPAVAAMVYPLPYDRLRVALDRPCYGVAPGQAAVCYQGDRVLGGGWIE